MQTLPDKKLLLIEDDIKQYVLIHAMLIGHGMRVFELTHVKSLGDAESYLADHVADVVLMGLEMTNTPGLEGITRIRTAAPRASIVVLSNPRDEPVAMQAIQEGAQDYLIKGQFGPRILMRSLLNSGERKNIEEMLITEKERAEVTLDCIGDAVICTDKLGNITFLNRVAERMTGWSQEESIGRGMAEAFRIVDATTRKTVINPMTKAISQNLVGRLPLNCVLIHRNGHEMFIEDSAAPIRDREGQVTGAVIVFRDVTETTTLKNRLTHLAQHDSLTGLPNRMLLSDRLGQIIALARRQRGRAAVLFLDLDGFKEINDFHGHQVGDRLLQSVANRLQQCIRDPDTVSRQGGDEFVVLLQDLQHPDDAAITAERMLTAVADVHLIDQKQLYVTASIGISVYPGDGKNAETMIRNADNAMYFAKRSGKHSYQFFKPEMIVQTMVQRPDEKAKPKSCSGRKSRPNVRQRQQ